MPPPSPLRLLVCAGKACALDVVQQRFPPLQYVHRALPSSNRLYEGSYPEAADAPEEFEEKLASFLGLAAERLVTNENDPARNWDGIDVAKLQKASSDFEKGNFDGGTPVRSHWAGLSLHACT